jgi:pimeloyl-ACP methyl ester carboxylesterase
MVIHERRAEILGRPARYLEAVPEAERRRPLVLVHGFNAWADLWRPNLAALAEGGRRVIAVDLPVHGGTAVPARLADLSVAGFVRWLVALLEATRLDRPDVVGHSFGGLLCGRLALDRPDLVHRLVLVSPAGFGLTVPVRTMAAFTRLLATQIVRGPDVERSRRYVLSYVCVGRPELDESVLALIGQGWRDPVRRKALVRLGVGFLAREADLRRDLARLAAPTLLIWGEGDRLLPVAMGTRAAERLPGRRLLVFERCGHIPNLEWPRRFESAVLQFLDDQAIDGKD